MRRSFTVLVFLLSVLITAGQVRATAQAGGQDGGGGQVAANQSPRAKPLPSIAERTDGFRKLDGFYPLYWDDATGTLYLEIPRLNEDVLYVTGLSAGLGSNDIGLDRAQLGAERLVHFERVGTKILMVQPNLDYRAVSNNADERRAVEDAFAKSIIWGFTAIAETGGRVLVDLTDFVMRDTHGVAASLRPATYRFDRSRSAVFMESTRAFPKNTEIDVTSTFVSDDAGRGIGPGQIGGRIADVTPSPEAATVRQHHSFIELPDANYTPRAFDPRGGFGNFDYVDYATPLGEPMRKQFIVRHRLQKRDPGAAMSDPVKPIIYYVDRGTPEPIRSALVEGARWWNQAFEAAGYRNAFQVEIMPEGADPMDVRYNTITWVHRSTRGWSYGSSITDPRTGEIIKGHVSLGSLRVRQDYLILEGLLSPYTTGTEKPAELSDVALARLRQLSAHEVGHTIGLGHNYYNSSKGRISVMDYPHPLITLRKDGTMDLSQAYEVGIGPWDKVSIQFGYAQFAPGTDEAAALRKILDDAWAADLRYLTNQDLDVNPNVDQWNNGTDVAAELTRHARRPARGPRAVWRDGDPEGPADGADRGRAGAGVPAPSLRGGFRGHRAGRAGLHLRDARRRAHAGPLGAGRRAAEGARRADERPQTERTHAAVRPAREDPAAAAGLRPHARAVPAVHRRRLRSDLAGRRRDRDGRVGVCWSMTARRGWLRSMPWIRRCRASRTC